MAPGEGGGDEVGYTLIGHRPLFLTFSSCGHVDYDTLHGVQPGHIICLFSRENFLGTLVYSDTYQNYIRLFFSSHACPWALFPFSCQSSSSSSFPHRYSQLRRRRLPHRCHQ